MITKLTNQELFLFCEHFSIILRSGMSAIEGLTILNDDDQTQRGHEILTFLSRDMEESGSLAHAMDTSGAFPASATAYVRTGEETGCLDEVMAGLAAFYQQEIQITEQIQSAVTYPLVMLGMMTAVIVILLVKVLPVFRQVFRQLDPACHYHWRYTVFLFSSKGKNTGTKCHLSFSRNERNSFIS